ncbi:MAG: hypothetical protein CFE21_13505 [Bacteroidetes bacterium B1(2017)]|nr:MAG: hypothetical protein CFE21_13505 [Bacteroidetes bacterium B1(2017)]
MRPRVCHFSSVHHVWDTRVFYRECTSLATEFDVTLIAIGEGSYLQNGVRVIGVPKPKSFLQRFLYTIFKVFILAVKEDASIYHIHDAEMVPFGMVLSVLGKKVIYDIHENTYDDILLKPWIRPTLRLFLAKLYNLLLLSGAKFMHYIVVVADPRYLTKFFVKEEECSIIQNFADPKDLQEFIVEDRWNLPGNHLFYVGMIRDMYYDIDPVIEALAILKNKGLQAHLHLIGYFGSETNKRFDTLPCWNEVKDQVHYYGFLETKEAYKVSMICKVGLCIKNQPENMLVSHERKLFEYMCIGLPSIFCNTSIYQELNSAWQIGLEVQLTSSSQLAVAIENLLTNPEMQRVFSKNNLVGSQLKFNWQFEAQKLLNVYSKLLTH